MCRKVLLKHVKEKKEFLVWSSQLIRYYSLGEWRKIDCLKFTSFLDRCILHAVTFAHQVTCLQKVSCPTQRFPYCFTVPSLTLLTIHIHTNAHIYIVKSQLISHTTEQRLYIKQGVLNAPNTMKVKFWSICDLTVH